MAVNGLDLNIWYAHRVPNFTKAQAFLCPCSNYAVMDCQNVKSIIAQYDTILIAVNV